MSEGAKKVTNQARGLRTGSLSEDAIESYLQNHLDFFERHSALLEKLRLPHARGGAAVSLVERQVDVLRERHKVLDQRLHELVEVARTNELLGEKVHRLARRLIGARGQEAVVAVVESALREDFNARNAVLIVFGAPSAQDNRSGSFLRVLERTASDLKMFDALFESGKPRCGQIRDTQRDYLFGKETVEIGSVALLPLGPSAAIGLLAIGSADAQHYHPGMNTEILVRIGELIAQALANG
jgi:uncharacterized protein YigA (DUF484 family)